MDVDGTFLQTLPDFLNGKPTSREISEDKASDEKWLRPKDISAQAEHAAQDGGNELRLPLIDFIGMFQEFDIALDDSWQRYVFPAPEFRRRRARDPCDSRGPGVVLDGDLLPLKFRQRLGTSVAVPFPR